MYAAVSCSEIYETLNGYSVNFPKVHVPKNHKSPLSSHDLKKKVG